MDNQGLNLLYADHHRVLGGYSDSEDSDSTSDPEDLPDLIEISSSEDDSDMESDTSVDSNDSGWMEPVGEVGNYLDLPQAPRASVIG